MRVHIANYEPDRVGGGWTAARYLYEGLECVDYDQADIFLICGASMVSHDQVQQAKNDGKKIVLRLDNAPRNSRNRNTGMTRVKAFCGLSDLVIYQSQWAKNFLMPFTQKDGAVILNGVDTKRFNKDNRNAPDESYLYVRSSRDEGKQWIMAWYYFVNNPGTLEIVGKFSPENLEYNFDFYNGERYRFMGEQKDMADVYRRNKYFLYTYLNEAGSNTLLEARASGCEIINVYGMLDTGSAPELMALKDISIERMIGEYRDAISNML
jgi:glycosyltransferase involved in cell wall biosynthesis